MQLRVQFLASHRTPLCLETRKRVVQNLNWGIAAFELIQEESQQDQRWGLKLSQVFPVSHEARILCAHRQRDAACGNKSTRAARGVTSRGKLSKHARRSHGAAVARSHIISRAEMPAIDQWWACQRGPCAAPCAMARSGAGRGQQRPPASRLRDASPWRTWPYGAQGRFLLSGAAAGPHCRATQTSAPSPRRVFSDSCIFLIDLTLAFAPLGNKRHHHHH
jgi:hypothetical protein